jgi:hypothetical protein
MLQLQMERGGADEYLNSSGLSARATKVLSDLEEHTIANALAHAKSGISGVPPAVGIISALSPTLRLPVQGPSDPYVSRTISTMYSRIAFHSSKGVRSCSLNCSPVPTQ